MDWDSSVYDTNRKMRMLNQSKPFENRPLKLVCGEIKDTYIGLTDGCEEIQYVPPKKKERAPLSDDAPPISNELLGKLLGALPDEYWDDRTTWIESAYICKNLGVPIDTWIHHSSKSPKFEREGAEKTWESCKTDGERKLGMGRLWSRVRELAPDAYAELSPCLLYTSPSPRDRQKSRMPSSA